MQIKRRETPNDKSTRINKPNKHLKLVLQVWNHHQLEIPIDNNIEKIFLNQRIT